MKALILTGKHTTHDEYVYPLHRLKEEGYDVDVATKGKETVLSDLGGKIVPTHDIPELYVAHYSLLILPGGAKAMEYMRQDDGVIGFIQHFFILPKTTVGSICHAAQLLISAGMVRGRRISGYYSIKDDIKNAGGTFVDAPFVTDGRIVTSPHYKHLGAWMKELLRVAREQV